MPKCRACEDAAFHAARGALYRELSEEIHKRSGEQFARHRDVAAQELRALADDYAARAEKEYSISNKFITDGVHDVSGCGQEAHHA